MRNGLALLAASVLLVACPPPTPRPDDSPISPLVFVAQETVTPEPTFTPRPSSTSRPPPSPIASITPLPTFTPRATPAPVTSTPTPVLDKFVWLPLVMK